MIVLQSSSPSTVWGCLPTYVVAFVFVAFGSLQCLACDVEPTHIYIFLLRRSKYDLGVLTGS